MTREQTQYIIDVIAKEHDFLTETICDQGDRDPDVVRDELTLRTFLQEYQKQGYNVYNLDHNTDLVKQHLGQ